VEFFRPNRLVTVTLKQLEAFYWVAELGGLEQAASRLSTTQSAISKRLQELESILGVALFDRTRRKAVITGQGERLLVLAREILDVRDRIMRSQCGYDPHPPHAKAGGTGNGVRQGPVVDPSADIGTSHQSQPSRSVRLSRLPTGPWVRLIPRK
jgi:hypothetical protein